MMNIPNIYQGLEVEPPMPIMIEQIHLRGKVLSNTQFVFVAEYWEAALKPYKRAKWEHERGCTDTGFTPYNFEIKSGTFLVFPEFQNQGGGYYAAHLYAITKELPEGPIYCAFTNEGLVMERKEEGRVVQRITLKPRAIQTGDTPYHAILSY